jgi:hypothetical protein
MSELIDIASLKTLSNNLDTESLDLGVSIHRTNPLPLDSSSLVWLEDWLEDPSQNIETEDIFREKAWEAVQEKIKADPTSYPGQRLTVIGKVDSVDKAISFIIQGKDHSHQDYNIDSETDTLYTQPHNVTVQELAYKSYVDKLTVELQDQIGNLTSVMNFRGVVKAFSEVDNPQLGDLIIITDGADPGTITVEKPGMEYAYTENGWAELGFGSQVITFINGTDGLSIPNTLVGGELTDTENINTLVKFIQAADTVLATKLGVLDDKNKFNIPKTAFATTNEAISSLLDFIKHSDKTLAEFIGVLTSNDELKLPEVLNSITKEATSEDTETLIKYLQSADESVIRFIYNLLGIDNTTFNNKVYTLKNEQVINAKSLFDYTQQADGKIIDQINEVDTDLQATKKEIDSLDARIVETRNLIDTKAQEVTSAFQAADNTIKLNIETLSGAVRDYVSQSEANDRVLTTKLEETNNQLTSKIDQLEESVSNRDKTYYIPSADLETLADIKTPYHGNYAIVTEVTDKGKSYKTAYIYDKTLNYGSGAWAALDGNYSASNVYFDNDIVITDPIGVVSQKDINDNNGFVTRAANGVSMQDFFGALMAKIKDPVITQPSLALSLDKTSFSGEVGTKFNLPKVTATLSPGSYSYGTLNAVGNTATDIIANNIEITDNKTNESVTVENKNTASYTPSTQQTFTDSKVTITYTADCDYPASNLQPINNIQTTKDEAGNTYSKINAGNLSKTASCTAEGYRKVFIGPLSAGTELNSTSIRSLEVKDKEEKDKYFPFTAPVGTTRLVVAFRTGFTSATPSFEYFTMSWESFPGFNKLDNTVKVEGANEYKAEDYTIYECTFNALKAATNFRIKLN